jgi:hypothetical protein
MPRGLKNRAHQSVEDPAPAFARLRVEYWPIERLLRILSVGDEVRVIK